MGIDGQRRQPLVLPAAHLAGLEHGQKRHLRLVDLIPMHKAPARRREIRRAFDEIEEGNGNLFAGDRGHGVIISQASGYQPGIVN